MRNECRNSHAKFGDAARRRCYAIWKKPQGGADIRPPPVGARVKMHRFWSKNGVMTSPKPSRLKRF